jgi:hypothetical protein
VDAEFRLKGLSHWLTMTEPKHWPNLKYPSLITRTSFITARRNRKRRSRVG